MVSTANEIKCCCCIPHKGALAIGFLFSLTELVLAIIIINGVFIHPLGIVVALILGVVTVAVAFWKKRLETAPQELIVYKVLLKGLTPFFCTWACFYILIQFASMTEPPWVDTGFPTACPEAIVTGCTRLAATNNNRCEGCVVPCAKGASSEKIAIMASEYMESNGGSLNYEGLYRNDAIYYYRMSPTALFGFIDDLVFAPVADGNTTSLWIQSQLRLGRGDMGVNDERVKGLRKSVRDAIQQDPLLTAC